MVSMIKILSSGIMPSCRILWCLKLSIHRTTRRRRGKRRRRRRRRISEEEEESATDMSHLVDPDPDYPSDSEEKEGEEDEEEEQQQQPLIGHDTGKIPEIDVEV
jgi:hypothetical protein